MPPQQYTENYINSNNNMDKHIPNFFYCYYYTQLRPFKRPEELEDVSFRLYSYCHLTKIRIFASLHVRDSQLTDWFIVCAFVQANFSYSNDATVDCCMASAEYC